MRGRLEGVNSRANKATKKKTDIGDRRSRSSLSAVGSSAFPCHHPLLPSRPFPFLLLLLLLLRLFLSHQQRRSTSTRNLTSPRKNLNKSLNLHTRIPSIPTAKVTLALSSTARQTMFHATTMLHVRTNAISHRISDICSKRWQKDPWLAHMLCRTSH